MKNLIRYILIPACLILLSDSTGCDRENNSVPVLILATSSDFGSYTAEILKSEGFNEFELDSLANLRVTKSYLSRFDLVILAESETNIKQKRMLEDFVKSGGNLIAVCPGQGITDLFGIKPTEGKIKGGYISIDTTTLLGKGLTSCPIQFHSTTTIYNLNGGKPVATIISGKDKSEGFPAVVCNSYGRGNTIAFLYNMPENVVYTRQGNPLFAGIEKDSIPGIRSMDMFTGGWIDTSNNNINQADEQMSLLSHCIENINGQLKPLPRFWYFPDTLKCLVTLTNDGEYMNESSFETQFSDVDSLDARMSIYIMETKKVSRSWADKWAKRGFEISGHPDDTREAANPQWVNMDKALGDKKKEIFELYGLNMKTVVNHWFVWCGKDADGKQEFAAQAELEAGHGIEMDVNYAHYDNNSCEGHFLGPLGKNQGNFTGSGLIMKFASGKGKVINIYQHLNNVYDQQYNENNDAEGFFECFRGLVDRSLKNEVYSYISVKSHNDEYNFSRPSLLKMLKYAGSREIPVWTVQKLLGFIRMKDQASFTSINMTGNKLIFNITSSLEHSNGLTFMVPFNHGNRKIEKIMRNDSDLPFIVRQIKGTMYALASVRPGNSHSIAVNYTNK